MSCLSVKEHSATLKSETRYSYISLIKSYPLQFDNCTVFFNHAFLFVRLQFVIYARRAVKTLSPHVLCDMDLCILDPLRC